MFTHHVSKFKYYFIFVLKGPSSKRSLLTKPQCIIKPQTKQPSKSLKPIQSIHLLNAPDDLYYKVTKKIEKTRQEIDLVQVKKLARTPFKTLKQYESQYATIASIWVESIEAATAQNGLDLTKSKVGIENGNEIVDKPPPATPPPNASSASANSELVVVLD